MIEELISRVFVTRNAAHLAHWRAKGPGSFARHMALGDFYDNIIDALDKIVELHQGAFGLIEEMDPPGGKMPKDIAEHIGEEANWLQDNRSEIAGDVCAIENVVDELAGIYLTAYYKLRNLS
jgi:hypothetical protein